MPASPIPTDHDQFYWQSEYDVAAQYLIPLFKRWNIRLEGASLFDIGCGDGGGLSAFAEAGMICKSFGIESYRTDLARQLTGKRGVELTIGNINDSPPFAGKTFDLVLLHDVFEHLSNKAELERIAQSCGFTTESRQLRLFSIKYC